MVVFPRNAIVFRKVLQRYRRAQGRSRGQHTCPMDWCDDEKDRQGLRAGTVPSAKRVSTLVKTKVFQREQEENEDEKK